MNSIRVKMYKYRYLSHNSPCGSGGIAINIGRLIRILGQILSITNDFRKLVQVNLIDISSL